MNEYSFRKFLGFMYVMKVSHVVGPPFIVSGGVNVKISGYMAVGENKYPVGQPMRE